jgi:hypothetical protein
LYIEYEIKRNKPSLIQPKLGVCAKVCFAYMLVGSNNEKTNSHKKNEISNDFQTELSLLF